MPDDHCPAIPHVSAADDLFGTHRTDREIISDRQRLLLV
jgi:hypothetical protein